MTVRCASLRFQQEHLPTRLLARPALAAVLVIVFAVLACPVRADGTSGAATPPGLRPLKVFVLAGQSNMQGHASIQTFDSLAGDPKTAPLLAQMRTADGTPTVCQRVWISSVGCLGDAYTDRTEKVGLLTAGFGAPEDKIGAEFTFGLTLEQRLSEPILLIKTAWGGRSLHTDFRPPSAGPFAWSERQLAQHAKRGEDVEKLKREKLEATGVYYRAMIEHVQAVLKDIKRVVPSYDPAQGYELAGFVWFQGFNDYVDSGVYPDQDRPNGYDLHATLLADLIRDVRKDLNAPQMPVVIGVMGIDGAKGDTTAPMMNFRRAQRAPALLDEFKGNVVAVETAPFWDDQLDALHQRAETTKDLTPEEERLLKAGVSNGAYHYLGAAKILAPIGRAFAEALLSAPVAAAPPAAPPLATQMAGYLLVPHERVDPTFDAGFSMYVAAWPLLRRYPGQDFQSGLFGTWMFARHDGPTPKHIYSDIEGGLGWWRDTRFATETPKFIMGGVALEFCEWANGPGAGKGRDWTHAAGHYAIAQLSPWVLWPPDGLNLRQGTAGELFGYGYLPLPLVPARATTAGKPIPTGDQSWTLFLNTGNFKGPVAFFLPEFWSRPTVDRPDVAGLFLDVRPSDANRAVQMETQHVPAYVAKDARGVSYARVAPMQFPAGKGGAAPLLHSSVAYSRAALWDSVAAWFAGGKEASGAIDPAASAVHEFRDGGDATWEIALPSQANGPHAAKEEKRPVAWSAFVSPKALDSRTYAYEWSGAVAVDGATVTLPQYFRLSKDEKGTERWVAVRADEVPAETGLAAVQFPQQRNPAPEPYTTPAEADSVWKKPGPAAGPFQATLGDGSEVTYYWYRFADQPAIRNADLTQAEREALQARVVLLHQHWTKDRQYLPPPAVGRLAELDPALIVTPPPGMEAGYVPIVTQQGAR